MSGAGAVVALASAALCVLGTPARRVFPFDGGLITPADVGSWAGTGHSSIGGLAAHASAFVPTVRHMRPKAALRDGGKLKPVGDVLPPARTEPKLDTAAGNAWAHPLVQFQDALGLATVGVRIPTLKSSVHIQMPRDWTHKLSKNSITLVDMGTTEDRYEAKLKSNMRAKVAFKVSDTTESTTQRELRLMQFMSSARPSNHPDRGDTLVSGHVVADFEYRVVEETTFILTQPYDCTLMDVLDCPSCERGKGDWPQGALHIGLDESLPLLIDILRGVRDLEQVGMVHGALTAENIGLVWSRVSAPRRALVAGLGAVCVYGSRDELLSCDSLGDEVSDTFVTSPYYQPPEVVDGVPTGPSDHVWAVGMLFVQMCFGYNPVEEALSRLGWAPHLVREDTAWRSVVREFVSSSFSISGDPNFGSLDEDVQELLRSTLESDPDRRFDTQMTCSYARRLARDRNIHIPSPRRPAALSDEWWF